MWNKLVMPPSSKLLNLEQEKALEAIYAPADNSSDILYYYNGPVSFLTDFNNQKVLVTKIAEIMDFDKKGEVWAVIVLSDEDILSLKVGEKPYIQYWLNRPNYIIETLPYSTCNGWQIQRIWKDVELHPSWLPEDNVKLFQE